MPTEIGRDRFDLAIAIAVTGGLRQHSPPQDPDLSALRFPQHHTIIRAQIPNPFLSALNLFTHHHHAFSPLSSASTRQPPNQSPYITTSSPSSELFEKVFFTRFSAKMQSHKGTAASKSRKPVKSSASSLHTSTTRSPHAKTKLSKTGAHLARVNTFSTALDSPSVKKHIPPPLTTPSYKGSILNKHPHNHSNGSADPTSKTQTNQAYDELLFDKHGHVTSNPNSFHSNIESLDLHVDTDLYDQTTISALKAQVVSKPIDQMKPLINVLLPKDAILDQFSYLRIRKIAKSNPDLLQMNENKLHQRLAQLSKIVLHPHFYKEYSQRYVYAKHNVPQDIPKYSVLTPDIQTYLAEKAENLEKGINAPHEQKELHLRSFKKLHQHPYHPMVLHVFERYPIILRRKHIENTPELIQQLFSDLGHLEGDEDDDGPRNGVESLFHNMNVFTNNVVPPKDDPEFGYTSPFHLAWNEAGTEAGQAQGNGNGKSDQESTPTHTNRLADPYSILGRFPKLLQFDLTNRLHSKIDSFTTILCTFLAQDAPLHDGIYTRDSISNARSQVLTILATQPDILSGNIYNTIPKRLDFIQKSCLFNSAQDTLDYVMLNPRLLTIPPSALQRLSLLRLKPPRFTDINPEQWAKLGFEQKFALDMVNRISELTPYPSLSHDLADNMKTSLSQSGKATGKRHNRPAAASPQAIQDFNQQETLYDQFDLSWAEYLESSTPASKYDSDRTAIAKKMGLKADIIPLLTMMHTKTFNILFGEFVEAKRRGNVAKGVYHGNQQQNQGQQQDHHAAGQNDELNQELEAYDPADDEQYDLDADYIPPSRGQLKQKQRDEQNEQLHLQQRQKLLNQGAADDDDIVIEPEPVNRHVSTMSRGSKAQKLAHDDAGRVKAVPQKPRAVAQSDATVAANAKLLSEVDPLFSADIEPDYESEDQDDTQDQPLGVKKDVGNFYNMVDRSESNDIAFKNGADHAPARNIDVLGRNKVVTESSSGDSIANPTHSSMFTKSDSRIHSRDEGKNKLHRYKGKGGQFGAAHSATDMSNVQSYRNGEIDPTDAAEVLNQTDVGSFGVQVSKKMFAELAKTPGALDDQSEVLDQLDLAQRRYVHKNKLQKLVSQKRRKEGQHDEENFIDELHYQYGSDDDGELYDRIVPTTVSPGHGTHIDPVAAKMVQRSNPLSVAELTGRAPKISITEQLTLDKDGAPASDDALYDVDFDLDQAMADHDAARSLLQGTKMATQQAIKQDEKHGKKTASSRPKGTGRRAPDMDSFENKWSGGARSGRSVL